MKATREILAATAAYILNKISGGMFVHLSSFRRYHLLEWCNLWIAGAEQSEAIRTNQGRQTNVGGLRRDGEISGLSKEMIQVEYNKTLFSD